MVMALAVGVTVIGTGRRRDETADPPRRALTWLLQRERQSGREPMDSEARLPSVIRQLNGTIQTSREIGPLNSQFVQRQ
jgi:hypothetical protein